MVCSIVDAFMLSVVPQLRLSGSKVCPGLADLSGDADTVKRASPADMPAETPTFSCLSIILLSISQIGEWRYDTTVGEGPSKE